MCNVALCELYLGVMIGLSWGRARRRDISPDPLNQPPLCQRVTCFHATPPNLFYYQRPIFAQFQLYYWKAVSILKNSFIVAWLVIVDGKRGIVHVHLHHDVHHVHRAMTCDCWWQTWHRNCCNWWSGRGAICFGRKRRCIGKLLDAGWSPVVRGSSLLSSVRSSSVYHGPIEIRSTHFFKFFKF